MVSTDSCPSHKAFTAWRLSQPGVENGTGRFCQRRAAFLASLAEDAQVGAASRRETLSFEPGHPGQPKSLLHRGEDEGVVASSRPCLSIRCCKQRVDLRAAEKADRLARESLARNREHSLDLRCVCRQLERRVAKEGMDRGQSQIAASNAQAPAGLELVEERNDQRGVNLLESQARGRQSETLLREEQELSEGVAIGGDSVWTCLALLHRSLGFTSSKTEGRRVGCSDLIARIAIAMFRM